MACSSVISIILHLNLAYICYIFNRDHEKVTCCFSFELAIVFAAVHRFWLMLHKGSRLLMSVSLGIR